METATIDLKRFCSVDEHYRFQAQEPFSLGDGWLYATDGRVIVRVPSDEPATEGRKLPQSIAGWPQWAEIDSASTPIPDIATLKSEPCTECDGKGKAPDRRECPTCDGEGDMECDMGHSHDCADCDGRGYCTIKNRTVDCPDCVNGQAVIAWGGELWGARFLRDITTLPDPVGKIIPRGSRNAYLVGRFDGGGQFILCSRDRPA